MKIKKNKKNYKILIIGYGSIGKQHYKSLNNLSLKKNIFFLSKRNIKNKNFIKRKDIKKLNPNYIIICSNTVDHLSDVKFLEKNLEKKIILIEKPVFEKINNFKPKKNKYFVNYQLRFHPVIQELKKITKNKKILNLQVNCNSFLPGWRNRDYKKSYSSKKILGGGVLLDLSHELDYILWIFKKIKINYSKIGKISKLKIDSDDSAHILGKLSFNGIYNINLSYFSRIPKRSIVLDCDEFSFYGDLINNFYKFKSSQKTISKFFKINQLKLLTNVHKKIINRNYKDLCTFKEGSLVLKYIKNLKF
jgi:predicted dehydrogenase